MIPLILFVGLVSKAVFVSDHTKTPSGFVKVDFPPGPMYVDLPIQDLDVDWRVVSTPLGVSITEFGGEKLRDDRRTRENKLDRTKLAKVVEKSFRAFAGEHNSTRVSDGWLFAVNYGEWGGGLYWFSLDWKKQTRLWDRNVSFVFDWQGSKYALGGLGHLGINRGYLLRIDRDVYGEYKARQVLDLGRPPAQRTIAPDGSLLVATSNGLIKVPKDGKPTEICKWEGMPFDINSMVCTPDGTIYIGQFFFLQRLRPVNGKYVVEWFVPKKHLREFNASVKEWKIEEKRLRG